MEKRSKEILRKEVLNTSLNMITNLTEPSKQILNVFQNEKLAELVRQVEET